MADTAIHTEADERQMLDAIDGTPVLDIKPWMREFDVQGDTHQPPWSVELMRHYY